MAEEQAPIVAATLAPTESELTGNGNGTPNPTAETPEGLPETHGQAVVADEVGLQVLEAELSSLKKALLEATAVDSAAVNIHKISSVDDIDAEDVAKAQLKVLLRIQSVVTRQYKTQQNALTAQMVASRMAETCSQILGYHLKSVEKEVWALTTHVASDIGLGQSTLEKMETTLDKFGTSFNTLGDTLKDMYANQRVTGNKEDELRRSVVREITAVKEILGHVRTNTHTHTKEIKNLQWQANEMRTGGQSRDSGEVSDRSGSLLATGVVSLENNMGLLLEGLTKFSHSIQEAIERGTDPSKSHKRKYEEEQQAEFQRQKDELEGAKMARQQEKRERVYHPCTGQVMYLTDGEKRELYKSLHLMKEGDIPMSAGPTAPTTPSPHPWKQLDRFITVSHQLLHQLLAFHQLLAVCQLLVMDHHLCPWLLLAPGSRFVRNTFEDLRRLSLRKPCGF